MEKCKTREKRVYIYNGCIDRSIVYIGDIQTCRLVNYFYDNYNQCQLNFLVCIFDVVEIRNYTDEHKPADDSDRRRVSRVRLTMNSLNFYSSLLGRSGQEEN